LIIHTQKACYTLDNMQKSEQKFSVLVLDTSRTVQGLMQRMIETACRPATVWTTSRPNEAINKMQTTTFDLVMLDWELAAKSNILNDIKKIKRKKIMIILTTLELTQEKIDIAIKSGAHNCTNKPFDVDFFKTTLIQTQRNFDEIEAAKSN